MVTKRIGRTLLAAVAAWGLAASAALATEISFWTWRQEDKAAYNEMFADFTAIWLLIHATRFGAQDAPAGDSPLERWREAGGKEGIAAWDRLRNGVEDALLVLGRGFLAETPELR